MADEAGSDGRSAGGSFAPPTISLPKGGGAVRGIGEKFAANPVTGTGSMTVPIATSPGRGGFGPQLSLAYDSGAGNGPFGFGWSLALPAITRKTDQGLPQYRDDAESDVFLLSGAEDLVPTLVDAGGTWVPEVLPPRTVDGVLYRVRRYRPRVEGLFARIERWTAVATGETHWRSITRDNVTTRYGRTANSRIADPEDPARVFSWLICESSDDKGNAVVYDYKPEDSVGVDAAQAHEANRTPIARSAGRHLKRIRYGNRVSRLVQPDLAQADWMFEVVFDYGEHDATDPVPAGPGPWPCRHDPFSSYRAGFEVRMYRLCQRVLMFHHFPGEPDVGPNCLVRSTDFVYRDIRNNPEDSRRGHPVASFIAAVTQRGYRRQAGGGYVARALPPLEFEYTQVEIQEEVRELDRESLENLPAGLEGAGYQWVDLDGEGVSGVLTEQAGGWFYKPNLGDGRFGPVELVATKPSLAALAGGGQQLLDLAGDGQLDLVAFGRPTPGFFERTADRDWEPFRPFNRRPDIAWDDPNLRFVDLDGDGHADVLVTEDDAITWYPSLAEDGFGPAHRVARPTHDEEAGPRLVFADGTQSVYLADMSGDGLTDLVRVRNGEVCYWPNLGYGRFGPKVAMDDAPWFDAPEQFDQDRIRLADIDGSGNTDIIYLGADDVRLYFNQSGNRWTAPQPLAQHPPITNLSSVTVADLLGNGTACLVWSSPLPGDARSPVRFIDLMGGQKPNLLVTVTNNLGAETRIAYAPSTRSYLADKAAGRPWVTRLPFPVHVVERVETFDHIGRNRFVTRYAYHHGSFDEIDREFRGFGMVEQWDTEEIGAVGGGGLPAGDNFDTASHVPPVWTRTWFHTGVFGDGPRVSTLFEDEYYREPGLTDDQLAGLLLPDTRLPAGLTPQEQREACRALKGSILRQEVYGLDDSPRSGQPYSVSERNYDLRRVQPRAGQRHAVFFAHPRETVDYHYERALYPVGGQTLADPRVRHALTLAVDAYGNVLASAAVGYGRRIDDPDPLLTDEDRGRQRRAQITYTANGFTNAVLLDDAYRAPQPCEARMFELLLAPDEVAGRTVTSLFRLDDIAGRIASAGDGGHDLAYENVAGTRANPAEPHRRLIEHARTLYRRDDLTGPLPLGTLGPLALPFESYQLAFTPGLVASVYGARVTVAVLAEAGYVHSEGDANWWIPSGRVFFSPDPNAPPVAELAGARAHFFLPRRFRDPFGQDTLVTHDAYDLLVLETIDALGNRVTAGVRRQDGTLDQHGFDYRVLQARVAMDPNRNRSAVAFDALGLVVGVAVMGKPEENLGDSLDGFDADLSDAVIAAHTANPLANPHAVLGRATSRSVYDLFAYQRTKAGPEPQPVAAYTLARETHDADLAAGQATRVQHGVSYSDGFGREIQKKVQAEPGPLLDGGPVVSPRWVGSGWTIFNNKGQPVRQFEPFFDDDHAFRFGREEGVGPILFYDPVERVVATLHPDHTWAKVVFDPWRQETWDGNDTVTVANPAGDSDVGAFFQRLPADAYLPTWHARRIAGALGPPEQNAAAKTAAHANTPTVVHLDSLGRPFLSIADNGPDGRYQTRTEQDIEGNTLRVVDARGNVVMAYQLAVDGPNGISQQVLGYDVAGRPLYQDSMDAGERRMLADVAGKPIRAWDSRGHAIRTRYDALQRPTHLFVRSGAAPEILAERTVYGEAHADAQSLNLRGQVYRRYDGAGVATNAGLDFKGNLRESHRRLASEYRQTVDWSPVAALTAIGAIESAALPLLESETFSARTDYDALNRPIRLTAPDLSETRPGYNEAGLLERMEVRLRGAQVTPFVTNVDYNAKGQRERITYATSDGQGVTTAYDYDRETFRLRRLQTVRASDNRRLQDLNYAYDPAGNITSIRDDAQQTVFFNNAQIDPHGDYTYDALYRLIRAEGREHAAQHNIQRDADDVAPVIGIPFPNSPEALQRYVEEYAYDGVGNILSMRHRGGGVERWTRRHQYADDSNRLLATSRPGDPAAGPFSVPYEYDAHGNMTRMPHLPLMQWGFKDQLQASSRQVVNNGGTPETTYYVYDGAGERLRKVTVRQAAAGQTPTRMHERIYLGGFERYREYNGADVAVTLERETLHVMDDQRRIALVETRAQGDDGSPAQLIRYQFGNHLGSVTLELDNQANVISCEELYPYGSTSYRAVRSQTGTLKRYRYTSKERDEETGLYYHGARSYAPWLGRWVSSDPAGIGDGPNLYAYAHGDPVRLADPTGHRAAPPELMGNSPYGAEVPNRAALGTRVQLDHPIQVSLRKAQRTAPGGKQFYSRAISSAARELTVLVETGKGLFHTEVGKLQKVIRQQVLSGTIRFESDLLHATRAAYAQAAKLTGAVVNELALDAAMLSNQAALHLPTAATVSELKATGSAGPQSHAAPDIDKAFSDTFDLEAGAAKAAEAPAVEQAAKVKPAAATAGRGSKASSLLKKAASVLKPVVAPIVAAGKVVRSTGLLVAGTRLGAKAAGRAVPVASHVFNAWLAIDAYQRGKEAHGTGGGIMDAMLVLLGGPPGFSDMLVNSQRIPRLYDVVEEARISPGSAFFAPAMAFGFGR